MDGMRYYKKEENGKITELSKSDNNFTGATGEIERVEYDSLILGIRVFLNGEDADSVKNDLNRDGHYDV